MKWCKDCVAEWKADPELISSASPKPRPIVEKSGGRCATHWRKEKARRKAAAHENRVQKVYGLSDGDYDRLYKFQGGVCAICRRARGVARKLAVDHDHRTGLVRLLACGPCNKIIGHGRDDPEFFLRIAEVLRNPPARQLGIEATHKENRDDRPR